MTAVAERAPVSPDDQERPSTEQLEDMLNESNAVGEQDTPSSAEFEVSPTAAWLDTQGERVMKWSDKLRERAQKKQSRQEQDDAFATYKDNVTYSQEQDKLWDYAQKANERFDASQARQERVDEVIEAGKDKLSQGRKLLGRIGRAGLRKTLSAGVMAYDAGQSGARTIKSAAETVALGGMIAKDRVVETTKLNKDVAIQVGKEQARDTLNATEAAMGRFGQKMESGVETAITKSSEMITSTREAFKSRKDAALSRWGERHTRLVLAERRTIERNKARIDNGRALGHAALGAIRVAKQSFDTTRRDLGDLRNGRTL